MCTCTQAVKIHLGNDVDPNIDKDEVSLAMLDVTEAMAGTLHSKQRTHCATLILIARTRLHPQPHPLHIHKHIITQINVDLLIQVHTEINTHTYTYIHTYIHTYAQAHGHIRLMVYMRMHTHSNTFSLVSSRWARG